MNQKQAIEVKDLAKPTIKAIKVLHRNKQQAENEEIQYPLEIDEWKWEPEAGEWVIVKDKRIGKKGWNIRVGLIIEVFLSIDTIKTENGLTYITSTVIPILHWEKIREILKQFDYSFSITSGASGGQITVYKDIGTDKIYEKYHSNNLQLEVMLAVIKLGKEVK